MKISYNPKSSQTAITTETAANDDIIFDLYASKLWAKGVRIGADWTDITSKPSSLKNPAAITFKDISGNNVSYDGSVARDLTAGTYIASQATKLQTARSLWGNSFDGTKDINGSIIFPTIGDTATSNKISWSGSSDGADIYYQTTAKEQGNLVLNVRDDNNAYIQLALNGVFKSHFDVANSYWTGRSARADKWTTARTLTIGNSAKSVDGSGNVSWTLAEIGVQNTWRQVQVNGTSIGTNTLNLSNGNYIGVINNEGKVTFNLIGSTTTANQAILSNGTANGWKLQTLNIDNWNTAYNFVTTISGSDTNKIIDRWDEIKNFLAGITGDDTLNTLLSSKLSITQLAAKSDISTIKNNALYWVDTKGNASGMTNGPFTNSPFAMLSVTNYNTETYSYRSRLAFNDLGEIKIAKCHSESKQGWTDTWYNILTSNNSGISGSTIKLNGTSITVYSSGTADGRYVKKSGDTMTGALNFANNTWNKVGDDVSIGDCNVSGCLGIKGSNNSTGLAFYNSSNTQLNKLIGTTNQFQRVSGDNTFNILDTSTTYINSNTITINGTSLSVSKSDHNHDTNYVRRWDGTYCIINKFLAVKINDEKGWLRIEVSDSNNAITGDYGIYMIGWGWHGKDVPDNLAVHCLYANNVNYVQALKVVRTSRNNYDIYFQFKGSNALPAYTVNYCKLSVENLNYTTTVVSEIPTATWTSSLASLQLNASSTTNADKLDGYHANGLFTALSNSNNGISITIGGTTKSINNISVNHAVSATNVIVNQHTANDISYPLVWSNQNNTSSATQNQLYKSWQDLHYNPKNKKLFVGGSVSTAYINATGTVTSKGFVHSSVTKNANQYVLTADGGYTFFNQTSNELAHEFSTDITVTSEWTDIDGFYGGNQNFLTQSGTYIVQVYYKDNSANSMYEGYFSGIMSWYTGATNSNNADEIVLHRVGHAYSNTIYLRTRESIESETNPYTKLQISANTDLSQHTYTFKFKRIC